MRLVYFVCFFKFKKNWILENNSNNFREKIENFSIFASIHQPHSLNQGSVLMRTIDSLHKITPIWVIFRKKFFRLWLTLYVSILIVFLKGGFTDGGEIRFWRKKFNFFVFLNNLILNKEYEKMWKNLHMYGNIYREVQKTAILKLLTAIFSKTNWG